MVNRRIAMWILTTVAGLVLLFSYRTSTSGPRETPAAVSAAAPTGVAEASATSVTVNGSTAQTRWGPVQVQVKIAAGKITDVVVLLQPNGNRRDQEINAYALPQLKAQVISAQSADINGVSGATVTTGGYVKSLQAALDAAHFGS